MITKIKKLYGIINYNKRLILSVTSLLVIAGSWLIPESIFRASIMAAALLIISYPVLSKRKYSVITIGYIFWFMKTLKPVEYVLYNASSRYGLARLKNNKWIIDTYSKIITLDNDGVIRDDSLYLFWLPLNKAERFEHLLSNDLPDFKQILTIENDNDRIRTVKKEYNKRV